MLTMSCFLCGVLAPLVNRESPHPALMHLPCMWHAVGEVKK